MPKVQVYSKRVCPYCTRAKALLQRKGVAFEEIDVENDDARRGPAPIPGAGQAAPRRMASSFPCLSRASMSEKPPSERPSTKIWGTVR